MIKLPPFRRVHGPVPLARIEFPIPPIRHGGRPIAMMRRTTNEQANAQACRQQSDHRADTRGSLDQQIPKPTSSLKHSCAHNNPVIRVTRFYYNAKPLGRQAQKNGLNL